jgi:prevent-host-death family protein
MSEIVEITAAKNELDELIERAVAGEEIVIGRNGEPLVRLVPVPNQPKRAPRVLGRYQGQIWIAPDCFEPMSEEELKEWEGR